MISRQAASGSAYELESTEQDSRRASNFPARPSASEGLSSRPPRTTRTLTFAARPGAAMHAQAATIVRRCMRRLTSPCRDPGCEWPLLQALPSGEVVRHRAGWW